MKKGTDTDEIVSENGGHVYFIKKSKKKEISSSAVQATILIGCRYDVEEKTEACFSALIDAMKSDITVVPLPEDTVVKGLKKNDLYYHWILSEVFEKIQQVLKENNVEFEVFV